MENEEPTINLSVTTQIDEICDDFETSLKDGNSPQTSTFVERLQSSDENRRRLAVDWIQLDRDDRIGLGQFPQRDDYSLAPDLRRCRHRSP